MKFRSLTNEPFGAKKAGYVPDPDADRIIDIDLCNRLRLERGATFVDDQIDSFEEFASDLYEGEDGLFYQVAFVWEDDKYKPLVWRKVIRG